jgi:hypothetical protein
MGLSTKVASFTWLAASTPGTTYDVTLGFRPEFAVVWTTGIDGAVDAITNDTLRAGVAFVVDGSNRTCAYYSSAQSSAASYSAAHSTTALSFTVSTTDGIIGGRLDVDDKANWPVDGIRFIVDAQSTSDRRVSLLAVGGTDITAVTVGSFQEPGATGNQTIAHGLGETPTGVLFASSGLGTAPEFSINSGAMCLSFGAFDGTDSWVTTQFGNDGSTTMDTGRDNDERASHGRVA